MFVCGDDVFDSNAIMIGVRPEAYPLGRYIDGKMTLALRVFVYFRLGAHSFFSSSSKLQMHSNLGSNTRAEYVSISYVS